MENSKGFASRLHQKAPNPLLKRPKYGRVCPVPQSQMSNRINSGALEIPVLESLPHPPIPAMLGSLDIIRQLDFFFFETSMVSNSQPGRRAI